MKTIDEVWLFKMLGESIDLYMARELKFFFSFNNWEETDWSNITEFVRSSRANAKNSVKGITV